ncbi:2-aminoethanethiol dioxygenase [Scaptodrosophila lebanonensis]|uniref:2-aminoethanethiol dioxygenase n=1 Tax=Drosophila lebanonensis TaxID=7225 RepID=A0A6J2T9A5_DROLE|nr:2-aminoethanethiol dioxygenase [Scaptodrosophila lebanonensis]
MTTHFKKVLRQALKTFERANYNHATFNANLQQLKQLTDQLTYRDLHLSKDELFHDAFNETADRAPCSYIHIFENELVSMSVFIMRPGYTMPLHDHPMMHGILRGIWGQLRVQSYTQQLGVNESEPLVYDKNPTEVRVIAEQPNVVTPQTTSALLTPRERNFHQITAVNGVAAFFDILSPPYDANMPIYGPRRCRFYRPKSDSDNQIHLQCIPSPGSYYCDLVDTPDSVLQCGFVCAAEIFGDHATEMQ